MDSAGRAGNHCVDRLNEKVMMNTNLSSRTLSNLTLVNNTSGAINGSEAVLVVTPNKRGGATTNTGPIPNPRPGAQQPGESKEAYEQRIADEIAYLYSLGLTGSVTEARNKAETGGSNSNAWVWIAAAAAVVIAIIIYFKKFR